MSDGARPKGHVLIGREAELEVEAVGGSEGVLDRLEASLKQLEQARPEGLTSVEILHVLAQHGVLVSEATLRKYVQLGLLPRSVRVGRKGKHLGSRGVYPTEVVRRIALIKALMAERVTMDEIRRRLSFLSIDIDRLEAGLALLITKIRQHTGAAVAVGNVASIDGRSQSEIRTIERFGRELIQRLRKLDSRLAEQPAGSRGSGAETTLQRVV